MDRTYSHLIGLLAISAELALLAVDLKFAMLFALVCGAVLTWKDLIKKPESELPPHQSLRELIWPR